MPVEMWEVNNEEAVIYVPILLACSNVLAVKPMITALKMGYTFDMLSKRLPLISPS
jgi:hypothetical protein